MPRTPNTIEAIGGRLVEVDRGYRTSCRIWQGATSKGFGVVKFEGRARLVHRLLWEAEHGSLGPWTLSGDAASLSHLCGQRDCGRIDHLSLTVRARRDRIEGIGNVYPVVGAVASEGMDRALRLALASRLRALRVGGAR